MIENKSLIEKYDIRLGWLYKYKYKAISLGRKKKLTLLKKGGKLNKLSGEIAKLVLEN